MIYINRVNILEIKECIELNTGNLEGMELFKVYIRRDSGELVSIPQRFMECAYKGQEPEKIREWEVTDFQVAKDIVANEEEYIEIPDEDYINENEIMKEFCWHYEDKKIGDKLKSIASEDNTQREFKKAIYDFSIYDEWYIYLDKRYLEKIIAWCEENEISYSK